MTFVDALAIVFVTWMLIFVGIIIQGIVHVWTRRITAYERQVITQLMFLADAIERGDDPMPALDNLRSLPDHPDYEQSAYFNTRYALKRLFRA